MGNIIKVDFTRRWSQSLDQLIERNLKAETFPGVEILFAHGEEILLHKTWGRQEAGSDKPMGLNTVFDIASITKPVATAALILLLQEQGMLDLEEPVAEFLPAFGSGDKSRITLRHLLTHTSGLPAWSNLHLSPTLEQARQRLYHTELETPVSAVTRYSCLNYLLLGDIIRNITGSSLSRFFEHSLAEPMQLRHTLFSPAKRWKDLSHLAPTQYCPWRKQLLRGVVHDENCFFFQEEGGNAGLFSTAHDLFRYCCMLLNDGELEGVPILSPQSVQQMLHNQNQPHQLPRSIGWDMKDTSQGYWSCGTLFPPGSVGHTGFTGTSLWFDPLDQWIVIVLTNRVHLSRDTNQGAMKRFRPRLHNLLLSMV
jgi:CubicO group peptidase (beta-lactamase class C family)